MTSLITYIEYALMTRHYCYVAGLGAFFNQERSAQIESDATGVRLSPPRREVVLNSRVTHDDGLLAADVMQARGVDYNQACLYIRHEVEVIRALVAGRGACRLGGLGELQGDGATGELRFVPAVRVVTPEAYGLATLAMPTWQDLLRQRDPARQPRREAPAVAPVIQADDRAIHISLPRRYVRSVAILLLVVCSFFATPLAMREEGVRLSEAAMLSFREPSEPLHINTLPQQTWSDEWEAEDYLVATDALDAPAPVATTPDAQPSSDATASATLPDVGSLYRQSANGKVYFIIVASCTSAEGAEQSRLRLARQGCGEVGLLERDGRYRLYINAFALKADALRYLDDLRTQQPFADAWLLPVGEASLSYYKNQTYNDNYLSMELSHAQQRTERGKG